MLKNKKEKRFCPKNYFVGYKASIVGIPGKSNRSLIITGVKEIKEYLDEKISLDIGGEFLSVNGHILKCITYTCGAVEIKGTIEKVEISSEYKKGATT